MEPKLAGQASSRPSRAAIRSGGPAARTGRRAIMQRLAITFVLVSLAASPGALAEGVEPAYSRGGVDYYSAPVEPAQTSAVPTQCERQYGKHAELEKLDKGYRCTVPSPSEPRLSTQLNQEIALADQFSEPRRQQVVDTLIDKRS